MLMYYIYSCCICKDLVIIVYCVRVFIRVYLRVYTYIRPYILMHQSETMIMINRLAWEGSVTIWGQVCTHAIECSCRSNICLASCKSHRCCKSWVDGACRGTVGERADTFPDALERAKFCFRVGDDICHERFLVHYLHIIPILTSPRVDLPSTLLVPCPEFSQQYSWLEEFLHQYLQEEAPDEDPPATRFACDP